MIMFNPTAEVIQDSISTVTGCRLTTMVIKYHRFIHSEFMTHRMLSKNSSSSRAIPVNKLIQNVVDEEVYPIYWGKNQKGMQSHKEISDIEQAKRVWEVAKNNAINSAQQLSELGVHKQIVNRILEPFSTITVIVSGTDWDNFFNQRCHVDAQPEIRYLANKMYSEYEASAPKELSIGEWHIPFIDSEIGLLQSNLRLATSENVSLHDNLGLANSKNLSLHDLLKISTGRCARVSYLNHFGVRNIEDDISLHDRLLAADPKHLSPFEHQAVVVPTSGYYGNFKGFKQYRKFIESNEQGF